MRTIRATAWIHTLHGNSRTVINDRTVINGLTPLAQCR